MDKFSTISRISPALATAEEIKTPQEGILYTVTHVPFESAPALPAVISDNTRLVKQAKRMSFQGWKLTITDAPRSLFLALEPYHFKGRSTRTYILITE